MKTKVLLSIGVVAITAFSFTFASSGSPEQKAMEKGKVEKVKSNHNAPAGGFAIEDRI